MVRLSRIALVLLVVAVLAATLPGLFWKCFETKVNRPFILYSPIVKEFVYRLSDEFGEVTHRDESGREYDRMGFEKLLPFYYYRDLKKWGELPDEVEGMPIDEDMIRYNMQQVRVTPDDMNRPRIDVYPMFESKSIYANLEYPPDVFRVTSRVEFIDAAENEIDEEKSELFTGALLDAGFSFPAIQVTGNPTTRKSFDEGYFIVDSRGALFHVKMIEGKPWCRDTGIRPESGIRYLTLRENSRREFYGALLDGAGKLSLVSYEDYALIALPLAGYEPDRMSFRMITDPLYRTFNYYDVEGRVIHNVVTDLNYETVRRFDYPIATGRGDFAAAAAELLFPFSIETASAKSEHVLLDFRTGGWLSLAGIAGALATVLVLRIVRKRRLCESPVDWVIVALTGFPGLVALLIIGREPDLRPSAES